MLRKIKEKQILKGNLFYIGLKVQGQNTREKRKIILSKQMSSNYPLLEKERTQKRRIKLLSFIRDASESEYFCAVLFMFDQI